MNDRVQCHWSFVVDILGYLKIFQQFLEKLAVEVNFFDVQLIKGAFTA